MRKILSLLMALAVLSGCNANARGNAQQDNPLVLATIYPLYVAALNLLDGVDGVAVEMLAAPQSGCMHDYQLSTGDRVKAERCDVLIINGLGLEPFLDKVVGAAGDKVITASDGYAALIEEAPEDNAHDGGQAADGGDHHDHGEHNPHIWVSPIGMKHQVAVIADGLIARFPEHAGTISRNAGSYALSLDALSDETANELAPYAGQSIITFHNAFPYFARDYNLRIAAVVEREPGAAPSAKELKEAADAARAENVLAIFTEPGYEGRGAQTLSTETALPLYTLNPATTGEQGDKNGYLSAMRGNTATLNEALGGGK